MNKAVYQHSSMILRKAISQILETEKFYILFGTNIFVCQINVTAISTKCIDEKLRILKINSSGKVSDWLENNNAIFRFISHHIDLAQHHPNDNYSSRITSRS